MHKTDVIGPVVVPTQVIGGETPNQETAIGAGEDRTWNRWKVIAGLVLSVALFFGVVAGLYSVFIPHQWTEAELNATFVQTPMEALTQKFGQPDYVIADPATGQLRLVEYRSGPRVLNKPVGTLVAFYGEDGRCVRVLVR